MTNKQKWQIVKWVLFFSIFLISLIYSLNLSRLDDEKGYRNNYDESMWTGSSITSYYMFFKGHRRKVEKVERWYGAYAQKYKIDLRKIGQRELQWYDDAIWTFGWKAPNIGKYLMGFAVVNFGKDVNPEGNFYHWNENKDQNKWPGNYSPIEHVELARNMNAILNAIGIALLFFIGWKFMNFTTGMVAAIYLLFNKTYMVGNSAAMLESSAILFTLLTLLITMIFFQSFFKLSIKKIILYSLLIGISFALAVGCKLNAALIGYVLIITFVWLGISLIAKLFYSGNHALSSENIKRKHRITMKEKLLQHRKKYWKLLKHYVLAGLVTLISTYVVFLGAHPHLRNETRTKVKIIRESVDEYFSIRARALGSENIKNSFQESLKIFIKKNYVKTGDGFYGTIGSLFSFGKFNPFDGLLILIGLIVLVRLSLQEAKKNHFVNHFSFFIILYFIYLWGLVDFLWIDWSRYHVPIFPIHALLVGLSIYVIGKRALSFIHSLKQKYYHA